MNLLFHPFQFFKKRICFSALTNMVIAGNSAFDQGNPISTPHLCLKFLLHFPQQFKNKQTFFHIWFSLIQAPGKGSNRSGKTSSIKFQSIYIDFTSGNQHGICQFKQSVII